MIRLQAQREAHGKLLDVGSGLGKLSVTFCSVLLGAQEPQGDPDAEEDLSPSDVTEICFNDDGSILAVGFEGGLIQVSRPLA